MSFVNGWRSGTKDFAKSPKPSKPIFLFFILEILLKYEIMRSPIWLIDETNKTNRKSSGVNS